jgi:gamma-glutamyl-gamma-aminobutyrate hydrolase PuuD
MRTHQRPWIAVNMDYRKGAGGDADRHQLFVAYVAAIVEAGGIPLLLPALDDEALLRATLARADAVVLTGGRDYPPALSGAQEHPSTRPAAAERTAADVLLARLLLEDARLPVLGICLGMQLLYAAHGGRLIADLPNAGRHRAVRPGQDRSHPVRLRAGSRLRRVFGTSRRTVNSAHHQGADPSACPAALRIAGEADDGTIEAVEARDAGRWLVGVQWHPERMCDPADRRPLFQALVAEAIRVRGVARKLKARA